MALLRFDSASMTCGLTARPVRTHELTMCVRLRLESNGIW
jgi:hypothetical protein